MSERNHDQIKERSTRRKPGYAATDTADNSVEAQNGLPSLQGRHGRISEAEVDHIERVIEKLPPWGAQLTVRGFIVGCVLGVVFAVVTLKLSLGTAGIVPSLNIPAGLISFAVVKSVTAAGQTIHRSKAVPGFIRALFQPFGVQENAVMQTFILSISGIAFIGGFGSYLTGMDYQAYLNTGGKPQGDPGYDPESIYNPELQRVIPYLLLVSILGVFMLTQLRKLMIIDWRLPFPSGTASGVMLTSFHTPTGEAEAMRKVRLLSWTGLGSFLFSLIKWIVNGADYGCGFGVWPSFGFTALKYTWNFDWQHNYIGAGMICPHIVNWSMLLGAILSWGIMWPLMKKKEGDWYPADLDPHDFKGLFGYKVFLTISILMGEGLYMVLRVMTSTSKDGLKRLKAARDAKRRALPRYLASLPSEAGTPAIDINDEGVLESMADAGPKNSDAGAAVHTSLLEKEDESKHLLEFRETSAEKHLRTEVFLRETIPWWLAPAGYGGLAVVSTIFIPMIYTPVKWYYVLVAYIITPLFALPNSYGAGLTDWDNCSMYGKLVLFVFAAWAGTSGNGIIVGLGICGVVFAATSSAATLMGDFRTGYICLAAPRAMFVAQLVGQLMGAILTPLAFMLYYSTGQVNKPDGPYPAPFSTIYRGMAKIGTEGFGALPKYCGVLMLTFFLGGMLICLVRDLLPRKYGRFVPTPMAMGIPFYIGAASAIDFWMGSLIMHIWEFIDKDSALELGSTVGAGLLVGDGLWSIPSSLIAIGGKAPPVCMGFYGKPMCSVPYCMGFWLGGSERVPTA